MPVEVGIGVAKNVTAALSAYGIGSAGQSYDAQAEAQVVVNWINGHGGLDGHAIVPVWATYDATSSDSTADQEAAMCAAWTQDHHVIAAVYPGAGLEVGQLVACLQQRGVPFIDNGMFDWDSHDYAGAPLFFNPLDLNMSRMSQLYVDSLFARGFFDGNARVGLMRLDIGGTQRASNEVLKPALAKHGLHLTDEIAVANAAGPSDYGNAIAQVQAAALRFSADGINRVLFLDYGEALFFMETAEGQHYYPKYGLSSYDEPGALLQGTAPNDQLANAIAVGWSPLHDVDTAHDPGGNPAEAACLQIYAGGGMRPSGRANQFIPYGYCDELLALRQAVGRGALSGATIAAGLEALGTIFRSAMTLGTAFGPSQHDGAATVRDSAFDARCQCFQYIGDTRAAG